jgi:hypothetical protein
LVVVLRGRGLVLPPSARALVSVLAAFVILLLPLLIVITRTSFEVRRQRRGEEAAAVGVEMLRALRERKFDRIRENKGMELKNLHDYNTDLFAFF